jgi:hypothetical protein
VEARVASVDYSVLPSSSSYIKVLIHGCVAGNGDTKVPARRARGGHLLRIQPIPVVIDQS